jgi:hypothetical protein
MGTAVGAFQGTIAAISQQRTNEAIRDQQASADAQLQQRRTDLSRRAQTQKLAIRRQAHMVRGRVRVTQPGGGTEAALLRQADFESALNTGLIDLNLLSAQAESLAIRDAQVFRLQAGRQNPMLVGVQAGLKGFGTGLSIAKLLAPSGGGGDGDDGGGDGGSGDG